MAKPSLYEIVLLFTDKDGPRPTMDTLARTAYSCSRLNAIVRYLERKTSQEASDVRQSLLLALCTAIDRGDVHFETEQHLYSFLVRVGINLGLTKTREPESGFIELDAMDAHQTQNGLLFSDGGVQAQSLADAVDKGKMRSFIKGIKLTQYNKTLMLQSSPLAHGIRQIIESGDYLKDETVAQIRGNETALSQFVRGGSIKILPKAELRPKKAAPPPKPPARRGRPPGPRSELGRVMTANHTELLDLYKKSLLLQADYAVALGLSSAAFKAYIYGRTKDVPKAVMESARKHAKDAAPRVSVLDNKFSGAMVDIIKRWEDEIAHQKLTSSTLSTILDIDETTVMRWRKGSKPTVRALSRYELKVKNFYKKM